MTSPAKKAPHEVDEPNVMYPQGSTNRYLFPLTGANAVLMKSNVEAVLRVRVTHVRAGIYSLPIFDQQSLALLKGIARQAGFEVRTSLSSSS